MPDLTLVAERRFGEADQQAFAALSGDYNPVHVDPVAARRTPAGAAVVHGMHGLLWALDAVGAVETLSDITSINSDFAQFLYVGETASVHVVRRDRSQGRIEVRVGSTIVARHLLRFGERVSHAEVPAAGSIYYGPEQREPLDLEPASMSQAAGEVAYFKADDAAASAFPALASAVGARRVTALLSLTRLVGMVCPGLHSTFHRISARLTASGPPVGRLWFEIAKADLRFALFTSRFGADGLQGTVTASRRRPPTRQPAMSKLLDLIPPGSFAGHSALVIGGSRGLGEVTAKLLGAGGASVTITYASGAEDADRVVAELAAGGCNARSFRLDCLQPVAEPLSARPMNFDTVYYFATPRITMRKSASFDFARFLTFSKIYVDAFQACIACLAGRQNRVLRVFYPSSVFVAEPTLHMAEYAMAKAAGEVLCADLSRHDDRVEVIVKRLARLGTDQTASMVEQDVASAAPVMAAVVMDVEQGRSHDA